MQKMSYSVTIKNGKVVDCISLKKELKSDLKKDEFNKFTIVAYDFKLENNIFKNGISKIAFKFAFV